MKKTTTLMMLGVLLSANTAPLIVTAQTVEETATKQSTTLRSSDAEESISSSTQTDGIEKSTSEMQSESTTPTVTSSEQTETTNVVTDQEEPKEEKEENKKEVPPVERNQEASNSVSEKKRSEEHASITTEEEKQSPQTDSESIDSWMPDKNLQKTISEVIRIPVESMTKADMLKITNLYIPSKNIYSLKGLEYATNLGGDVGLNYNHISDISPLFNLKITYLRLAGNNISDVHQFLHMPYLTSLIIPENLVKDLSPIYGSQYTTIAALDQRIYLEEKTVFADEEVGTTAGIVRPNGDQIISFSGMTSYDTATDYLSWQLTGGKPKTVTATWDDSVWVREHYNAKGTGYAGFSGQFIQPLQYKIDQTAVNVHDSTVYLGDSWDPQENFDSAFDREGNQIAYSEITVDDSKVNLAKPGIYKVTYSYKEKSAIATITVKDKSKVSVHYMNEQGKEIHESQLLLGKPKETYDTSQSPYFMPQIDDYYVDTQNLPANRSGEFTEANQTVIYKYKKDLSSLSVHDTSLTVGDTWNEADNFDQAKDSLGNEVSFDQLTYSGLVDTTKAGTYKVTYEQTVPEVIENKIEGKHYAIATITVLPKDETHLKVHDSQLTVGDSWKAEDNFDYAKDFYGNEVPFSAIQVTGSVDTSVPGEYQVNYAHYVPNIFVRGLTEGTYEATATITVKEPVLAAPVTVKYLDESGNKLHEEKTINGRVGESFDATLSEYQLTIEGYVLTSVPENAKGTLSEKSQQVIYVYKKNLSQVRVHDSQLTVGDSWKAEDNFDYAKDFYGNEVPFSAIQVTGFVDTAAPGEYQVNYAYYVPNIFGKGLTQGTYEATATITVTKPTSAAPVTVKYLDESGNKLHEEKTINGRVGESFDATLSEYQLTIEGYVLTSVPKNAKGTFSEKPQEVIYEYKKELSQVSVHDSVIFKGDSWRALDNFDFAKNSLGESVAFEQMIIEGSVETNKVGTYQVNYRLPADERQQANEQKTSAVATIRVIEKESDKGAPVTVRYQDTKGELLVANQTLIGLIGETYLADKLEIEGYKLVQVVGNEKGIFTNQAQTVTYVYEKRKNDEATVDTGESEKPEEGNVIIRYTDEQGNSLATEKVITGKVGSNYRTNPMLRLPKTGENQALSSLFTKLGIGILVMTIGVWGFLRRISLKKKSDR